MLWKPSPLDYEVPPSSWFQKKMEETLFTPDSLDIGNRKVTRMFIYDEMLPGRHRFDLIDALGTRRATAFTLDKFVLWRTKMGKESYPVPLTGKYTSYPPATPMAVKGEIWDIFSPQVFELDSWKLNGVEFLRQRVYLILPYRDRFKFPMQVGKDMVKTYLSPQKEQIVSAEMYVGIPEHWEDMLTDYHLRPVKHYTPGDNTTFNSWEDPYYFFTPGEYNL